MAERVKSDAHKHRPLMKIAIGVIVGFAAGFVPVHAATELAHDGGFWNELEANAKQEYIAGYFDGMRVSKAKIQAVNVSAQALHWRGAPRIIAMLSQQLLKDDLTSDRAVDYLDDLYGKPKWIDVELGHALELLMVFNHQAALATGSEADRSRPLVQHRDN